MEAERQRQREWEQRRKDELLNQKGLEEDIVKGLKLRLEKLKGELIVEVLLSTVLSYRLSTMYENILGIEWLVFNKLHVF